MSQPTNLSNGLSLKSFMAGTVSAAATVQLLASSVRSETPGSTEPQPRQPVVTSLRINKQSPKISIDTRTSLLDALRDPVGLTDTKKGCDHGQCGACTVLVDGERALPCLSFAVMNEGKDIITVEGLASSDGKLHPMQQAFIDHDAFQCGYCTPGQILSAIGCVNEGHAEPEDDIREYMTGNICRCRLSQHCRYRFAGTRRDDGSLRCAPSSTNSRPRSPQRCVGAHGKGRRSSAVIRSYQTACGWPRAVDHAVNPASVKGLGELGNVGTAAAVASAGYHVTGQRIRDLPIRIEQLLT